jgi:type IV pilus assembly protein PilV
MYHSDFIQVVKKTADNRSADSCGGFTLIEMLVAVVVLSVGLLGLASLQALSLRTNDGAYYRTQAAQLGYDILERMRSNTIEALTLDYDTAGDGTFGGAAAGPGAIATADVLEWQGLIDTLLPGGGVVSEGDIACVNPAAGITTCTVTIQWDDSRSGGAAAQQITLNAQL